MKKLFSLSLLSVFFGFAANAFAADEAKSAPSDAKTYSQAVDKAIQYLTTKGQAPDGSFSAQVGPGVTAIVVTGILSQGAAPTIRWWRKHFNILKNSSNPTAESTNRRISIRIMKRAWG